MNPTHAVGPTDRRSLAAALDAIQMGQLIRRAEEEDAVYGSASFIFKHGLVQETAYSSILRQDRKRLHALVAHALEEVYPERVGGLAPQLASHLEEAGELDGALYYLKLSAEDAAARFANREALAFYARALKIGGSLHSPTRAGLYTARGVIYERIGEFEPARQDLEAAVRVAREDGDRTAEWEGLLHLGYAWLARDYARAGEYFERALELARESEDAARIAQTLNRVGNWYLNSESSEQALSAHHEALEIYQTLGDMRGLADTQDLLGMSNLIGSNYIEALPHHARALELYTRLEDRQGMLSAMQEMAFQHPSMQTDLLILPEVRDTPQESLDGVLAIARELGLRATETFVLWVAGENFAGAGQYGRGLELMQEAIALAEEIGHQQWLAGATVMRGAILNDLLDDAAAVRDFQRGLELAREINSVIWIRIAAGFLATTYITQGRLDEANALLDEFSPENIPPRTAGQRQSWKARVELALARHDPERALMALDLMLQHTPSRTPETVLPLLWMYRALALLQLNLAEQAETFALAAQRAALEQKSGRLGWRAEAVLSRIYRVQGRQAEAAEHAESARHIVAQLSDTVADASLRNTFRLHTDDILRGERAL